MSAGPALPALDWRTLVLTLSDNSLAMAAAGVIGSALRGSGELEPKTPDAVFTLDEMVFTSFRF